MMSSNGFFSGISHKGTRSEASTYRLLSYSITSSARASTAGGIVRPSAFAVLRLMTRSNLRRLLDGQVGGFGPLEDLVHDRWLHAGPDPSCSHCSS